MSQRHYLDGPCDSDDPCPDCGKQLWASFKGGVYCPDDNCGYWFCY